MAYQLRSDFPAVLVCSERLICLGTEHKLPQYNVIGSMMKGWVSVHQGKTSEGIEDLRQGLAVYTAQAKLLCAFFYATLAEAYHVMGDWRLALATIDTALDLSDAWSASGALTCCD